MATKRPGMLGSSGGRSNSAHNVFIEYHKHRPSVMKGMHMQTVIEGEEDEKEFSMFRHVVSRAMLQEYNMRTAGIIWIFLISPHADRGDR